MPKGRRGNNFTFLTEDFRYLSRSVDEDISAIFRGSATKAGGEKTSQEWAVIFASALSAMVIVFWTGMNKQVNLYAQPSFEADDHSAPW